MKYLIHFDLKGAYYPYSDDELLSAGNNSYTYDTDGDAGIMQVGARYYDPATGSFLTRDTDINQLAYVYCGNDPIGRLDPSGHGPLFSLISAVIKVVKTANGIFVYRDVEIATTIESGSLKGVTLISMGSEAVGLSLVGWIGYGYAVYQGCQLGYQFGSWFVSTPTGQQFTNWFGNIISNHLSFIE